MEAIEDAKWYRETLNDGPRQKAIKVELNWISFDLLHFKSVDEPQGHVGDEQKRDGLSARLLSVVFGRVDTPAGHVRDVERLYRDFNKSQQAIDEHQNGRLVCRRAGQRSGDH